MFWFKVHTFLDTALEPSRGRKNLIPYFLNMGWTQWLSSNEQNKADVATWLQGWYTKDNEALDFLFWITNSCISQPPCSEDTQATLWRDPCVEASVSAKTQ